MNDQMQTRTTSSGRPDSPIFSSAATFIYSCKPHRWRSSSGFLVSTLRSTSWSMALWSLGRPCSTKAESSGVSPNVKREQDRQYPARALVARFNTVLIKKVGKWRRLGK